MIADAAQALEAAGVARPRWEAIEILAAVSEVPAERIWTHGSPDVSAERRGRYHEALVRRARGEPLAYVLGATAFRLLQIAVDRRVLIPRPETEGLVQLVLEWAERRWPDRAAWGAVVDVGTGSGCIAASLAQEGHFERVIATDASAEALAVAAGNVDRLVLDVQVRAGHLLDPLDGEVVDIVVSNPPYVTAGEFENLPASVRLFEPHDALVSGSDGLSHTRGLLLAARLSLVPGGLLAIEIDSRRADATVSLAAAAGLIGVRVERDVFDRPRYLLATKEPHSDRG